MNVSCFISNTTNALSAYEQLCLYSFARRGYTVNLYTYNNSLSAPAFISVCSASNIIPKNQLFENVHEAGSYSMFSNLFRYRLLNQKETTWIDTDVLLVADRLPDRPYLFGWQDDSQINGAVLRVPPNSQLGKKLIENCTGDPKDLYWGVWGPRLLTRVIAELGLLGEACSVDVFYSVHWRDALATLSPSCAYLISSKLATANTIHLWNEMLRRQVSNYPLGLPPAGSYLHQLVQQWNMQSLFTGSISATDVDNTYAETISSGSPFVTPLADKLVASRDIVAEEKRALLRELEDANSRVNRLQLALQETHGQHERMARRIEKLRVEKDSLRATVEELRKYSILRMIPASVQRRVTALTRRTHRQKQKRTNNQIG